MTTLTRKTIIFFAEYAIAIPGIIILAFSLFQDTSEEGLSLFLTGGILLLITILVKEILKRVIKKRRPEGAHTFFRPGDYYAFPSGHASGLAAVTLFIFSHNVLLGSVSFIVSLFILIARVRAKVHDIYDMIGGVLLGALIVFLIQEEVELLVRQIIIPLFS